jgi:hypothetical protein
MLHGGDVSDDIKVVCYRMVMLEDGDIRGGDVRGC